MKNIGVIVKKELYRVFSDKKLIFSLFILPCILMVGVYSLMGKLISSMNDDIESHVSIVTMVNAPDEFKGFATSLEYDKMAEITWVDDAGYSSAREDIETELREGDRDLIIYFDSDLEAKVNAYSKEGDPIPPVVIYYNQTEEYSAQAYNVFDSLVLSAYEDSLLAKRIGNMELIKVLDKKTEQICKESKLNTQFISMMLPYIVVIMLFSGVMSIGNDAIAGEKERGTLASMLLSPVKRKEIVSGKLISMCILSGLSALVYAVSMLLSMPQVSSSFTGGDLGRMALSPISIVEFILSMLIMDYLFVTIVGFLATLAKDTKTAASLISPVYIVVMVLAMMTMFGSIKDASTVMYAVPVYGNALAIQDLISNELTTLNFAVSVLGPVAIAVVLTFAMAKAFDSEKIMFNA